MKLLNDEKSLLEQANANLQKAYAPYSEYRVGAAVIAGNGKIYNGANVETVIHRSTHAERLAMDNAALAGQREIVKIVVVTDDPGAPYPCGQCLQDLTEFGSGKLVIIAANVTGTIKKSTLSKLLPERFGPKNLGKDPKDY